MSDPILTTTLPAVEFLDDVEVARRLAIAPITLRKWRAAASGPPFVKMGRAVRYSWPAVLAWVESRQVGGAS